MIFIIEYGIRDIKRVSDLFYGGILPMKSHIYADSRLMDTNVYLNSCVIESTTSFHAHKFIEIAYVSSGAGEHQIGDKTFRVTTGDVTIINFDIPHQFTATDSPLVIYNCIFTPSFLDSVLVDSKNFCDLSSHYLLGDFYHNNFNDFINNKLHSHDHMHILNIYKRMLLEFDIKKIGYKEILRGYLIELLVTIFRLNINEQNSTQQNVINAIEYICIEHKNPIRIETLAKLANSNKTTFCRNFKELTNSTVVNFIQTLRIEKACNLILSTEKNIIEIAQDVGYNDMKHFYSIFKKITGRLPRDFKKEKYT